MKDIIGKVLVALLYISFFAGFMYGIWWSLDEDMKERNREMKICSKPIHEAPAWCFGKRW